MHFERRELRKHSLVRNLQSDDSLWFNLQLSQEFDLIHVERAAVQDPAVEATVRLAETLVDQFNHHIVGYNPVVCDVALELQ